MKLVVVEAAAGLALRVSLTCLRRKRTKQPPLMPAPETRRRNGCMEVKTTT